MRPKSEIYIFNDKQKLLQLLQKIIAMFQFIDIESEPTVWYMCILNEFQSLTHTDKSIHKMNIHYLLTYITQKLLIRHKFKQVKKIW